MDSLRRVLINVARLRTTISYSELAAEVGLHQRDRRFSRWLYTLCGEEVKAGRANLCALVVGKSSGIPGAGYFKGYPESAQVRRKLWEAEAEAAWEYWGDQP